jgi:hypothetical protein
VDKLNQNLVAQRTTGFAKFERLLAYSIRSGSRSLPLAAQGWVSVFSAAPELPARSTNLICEMRVDANCLLSNFLALKLDLSTKESPAG